MNKYWEFYKKSIMYIKSDLYPDGSFIPQKEGRLSLWDRGFRHGITVYTAGRTFKGKPWQINQAIGRLNRYLKVSHIDLKVTPDQIDRVVREICTRNKPLIQTDKGEDLSFLIDVTPGEYGIHGHPLPPPEGKGQPTFVVRNSFIDTKSFAERFGKGRGFHLVTPSTRNPPPSVIDSKIKTHSRHFMVSALHEAQLVDVNAMPLFLDLDGNLTETNVTNIFLVYQGELMTPTTRNVLEGSGRSNVLQVAKNINIPVIERDLQPYHLLNAEEAFISVVSRFLSPVSRYNGVPIGNEMAGPITTRLMKAFIKSVNYDVTGISFLTKEERKALNIQIEFT